MARILIIGATGQQGGSVLAALAGRGHDLVALVRDPSSAKARALADGGVDVVPGDLGDRASLVAAFSGVDAAFAVTTPSGGGTDVEAEHGVNIAEAAAEAELPFLVFSSVASADEDTGIPHFDSKYAAEQRLAELGVRAAVVAPVYFMENLVFPWNIPSYQAGELRLPIPSTMPLQLVSSVDIGRAVAEILERPEGFADRRIELVGDSLTGPQMAEVLSAEMGRPLTYVEQPMAEIAAFGADMVAMFEWLASTGYSADGGLLARELPAVRFQTLPQWAAALDWRSILAAGEG